MFIFKTNYNRFETLHDANKVCSSGTSHCSDHGSKIITLNSINSEEVKKKLINLKVSKKSQNMSEMAMAVYLSNAIRAKCHFFRYFLAFFSGRLSLSRPLCLHQSFLFIVTFSCFIFWSYQSFNSKLLFRFQVQSEKCWFLLVGNPMVLSLLIFSTNFFSNLLGLIRLVLFVWSGVVRWNGD